MLSGPGGRSRFRLPPRHGHSRQMDSSKSLPVIANIPNTHKTQYAVSSNTSSSCSFISESQNIRPTSNHAPTVNTADTSLTLQNIPLGSCQFEPYRTKCLIHHTLVPFVIPKRSMFLSFLGGIRFEDTVSGSCSKSVCTN